jgi:hypothetical protein
VLRRDCSPDYSQEDIGEPVLEVELQPGVSRVLQHLMSHVQPLPISQDLASVHRMPCRHAAFLTAALLVRRAMPEAARPRRPRTCLCRP